MNRVYEEFIKLSGLPGIPAAQKCTAPVLPLPQRLVKNAGDVFVPILPAIVAAGLLTGILTHWAGRCPPLPPPTGSAF